MKDTFLLHSIRRKKLTLLRLLLFLLLFTVINTVQAQMVTLNFKDMDINLLIDTVAEVTHKTFIVDPRVKANITVVSSKPMDSEQVYEVFLSILNVHGFSAIPSGNVIKIVPQSVAKSDNIPVIGQNQSAHGDELVTQVIQVENVSAPLLIPLLRPLLPQQAHLVAYTANNTLIISDTANNVNRLREIVNRIDKADKEETEVIMLQHASALEVINILNTLGHKKATEAAANGTNGIPSVAADERTNSILITGDSNTRLKLRAIIAHLDTPLEKTGRTQVIYLHYARAEDLVNVLQGVSDTSQQAQEGQTPTAPLNNYKANIQADTSTNSIIITAEPDELKNLQSVIRQLDIRRAQVLVEAIIAEISTDTAKELGVQWLFDGTPNGIAPVGASNFTNAGTSIINLAGAAAQFDQTGELPSDLGAGAFLGIGRFGSNLLNFAVLLRALSADTNVNVLSTPSLLTLDNQEAEIIVGQNVPFVTGQYTNASSGTDGATNPFQTIQREDVGIKLKVSPQINEGNAVQLQIEQEVSSISRDTTAGFITNKRSIKTTVIVEDGNMIVLGGLIDENLQQVSQKVPGLGDVPILGGLFRSQSSQKVKRNLMIFLHPVIVRDASTEALVSSGKYSYMRAKQLEQKDQVLSITTQEDVPVLPDLNQFITLLPDTTTSLPNTTTAQ